jgi:hypothetical protein
MAPLAHNIEGRADLDVYVALGIDGRAARASGATGRRDTGCCLQFVNQSRQRRNMLSLGLDEVARLGVFAMAASQNILLTATLVDTWFDRCSF